MHYVAGKLHWNFKREVMVPLKTSFKAKLHLRIQKQCNILTSVGLKSESHCTCSGNRKELNHLIKSRLCNNRNVSKSFIYLFMGRLNTSRKGIRFSHVK